MLENAYFLNGVDPGVYVIYGINVLLKQSKAELVNVNHMQAACTVTRLQGSASAAAADNH